MLNIPRTSTSERNLAFGMLDKVPPGRNLLNRSRSVSVPNDGGFISGTGVEIKIAGGQRCFDDKVFSSSFLSLPSVLNESSRRVMKRINSMKP